jgi:hypothetical protein
MSYGFKASNNQGQVLVSSEMRNLHFFGKATLLKIDDQSTQFGGAFTGPLARGILRSFTAP